MLTEVCDGDPSIESKSTKTFIDVINLSTSRTRPAIHGKPFDMYDIEGGSNVVGNVAGIGIDDTILYSCGTEDN